MWARLQGGEDRHLFRRHNNQLLREHHPFWQEYRLVMLAYAWDNQGTLLALDREGKFRSRPNELPPLSFCSNVLLALALGSDLHLQNPHQFGPLPRFVFAHLGEVDDK